MPSGRDALKINMQELGGSIKANQFYQKGKRLKPMLSLWGCKGAANKDTSSLSGNTFITVSAAMFLELLSLVCFCK